MDHPKLFDIEEYDKWKEEWQGMPEFIQEDLTPLQSVIVHFATREDMDEFAALVQQKLTYKTRSIWYPKAKIDTYMDKLYVSDAT